ncbi:MAG: VOC family protein [Spirochaetales bacterium]|nr:VOC family protein [Spirochaetales bacterium]
MKQLIQPCFWFDKQASEAAAFYRSVFPDVEVLSAGETVVNLKIADQRLMLLNGGPYFSVNPSISLFYHAADRPEIDRLWQALLVGGEVRMPLKEYPFAPRYGFLADQFGVNWQLILPRESPRQKLHPSLMFTQDRCGRAEEAIQFYTNLFPNSSVGFLSRYGAGAEPDKEGALNYSTFELGGQWFSAMDSAQRHPFTFTEGVSLFLECDTQDEIDFYWSRLGDGGSESQCGWLKDRFGLSWQVVPKILGELMADPERAQRVVKTFLPMKKLIIDELIRA